MTVKSLYGQYVIIYVTGAIVKCKEIILKSPAGMYSITQKSLYNYYKSWLRDVDDNNLIPCYAEFGLNKGAPFVNIFSEEFSNDMDLAAKMFISLDDEIILQYNIRPPVDIIQKKISNNAEYSINIDAGSAAREYLQFMNKIYYHHIILGAYSNYYSNEDNKKNI